MKTLLAAALLSLFAASAQAQVGIGGLGRVAVPQVPRGFMTEHEADARLFKKFDKNWDGLAEASVRWQGERRQNYRSIMMGPYYRMHKNLKLGAFYKLQYGARYDEDWTTTADSLGWSWRDTTIRPEHLFILDASPRAAVPGVDDTVATMKVQLQANVSNGKKWLRLGPEITHHFVHGLKPVASVTLQYDGFISLNQHHETLYDQWIYVGALYHATPKLSVGPRLGLRQWVWKDTEFFRNESRGVTYRVVYRAVVMGLDLIYRL